MQADMQLSVGDPIGIGYGAISASVTDPQQITKLTDALKRQLVAVDSGASCSCIDGRPSDHTLAGNMPTARPSLAGGPVTPYVAAELTGWFGDDDGTTDTRFKLIDDFLNGAGLPTGSHSDLNAESAGFPVGKTGCGADDKLAANVGRLYDNHDAISGFVARLLDDSYDPGAANLPDKQQTLTRLQAWNPNIVIDTIAQRNPSAIEILHSDASATHGHIESLVVFNKIENTTVDRDAFAAQTNAQAFAVDLWYISNIAKVLAHDSNDEMQIKRLLQTMVAYQVGTYLTLCDGSQRPVIISPVV